MVQFCSGLKVLKGLQLLFMEMSYIVPEKQIISCKHAMGKYLFAQHDN